MDNDIDFEEVTKPSKSVKQGRRAARAAPPPVAILDDEGAEEDLPFNNSGNTDKTIIRDGDAPPRPKRQLGGWGEARSDPLLSEELEDERLRPRTAGDDGGDSDPDIPVIPDLDDQQEDEYITATIAMAPSVAINRVATYRELDNDLLSHAQFLTLDNEIDLKLLGKCLSSEVDVYEQDKPWDWDRLFTEVTSEMLTEWEKKEEKEDDDLDIAAA